MSLLSRRDNTTTWSICGARQPLWSGFYNPWFHVSFVADYLPGCKEQVNLFFCVLLRIGAVYRIATDIESEVTPDCDRRRFDWVGCSHSLAHYLDRVRTFENSGHRR